MSPLLRPALLGLVRLLLGGTAHWHGCLPEPRQRIYFANHTSHVDTLAIWAAIPSAWRHRVRPVAARDYWDKTLLRRHIAKHILNVVMVNRGRQGGNPLRPLDQALAQGDSLILFPEGTRSLDDLPGPFKPGLAVLAQAYPATELVPVYLENLNRSLPKGTLLPVPMACTVRFGTPIQRQDGESHEAFLERARAAVIALASYGDGHALP